MDTDTSPKDHRTFASERLVMFSDGVMAFAITLLALNIKAPRPGELVGTETLTHFLWEQWPAYLIFALSFIVIVMVWANHHNVFRCFHRSDQLLVLLNAPILMCVVLIPFAASLLAEYLRGSRHDSCLAALIYGGLFTVGSAFFNLVWWYGHRRGLADPNFSPALRDRLTRHFKIGPFLYGVATLLAFVSVWVSVVLYLAAIARYLIAESDWFGLLRSKPSA